jgi:hypothetical protein
MDTYLPIEPWLKRDWQWKKKRNNVIGVMEGSVIERK